MSQTANQTTIFGSYSGLQMDVPFEALKDEKKLTLEITVTLVL